jgi:hypothetical protein
MLYLAIVATVAVLGAFIVPVLLAPRRASPRDQDALVSAGPVMPGVIQNSSIAYAIGLVTLVPLLGWGLSGQFWPALVYVASVGLGLSLIYMLRRPVLQFLDDALIQGRSVTVHEFISLSHGSDPRVRVVAADLTMVAVCGLIVCAMLGLATVLKPLLADSAGFTELFIAAIFLVVVTCTLFSGHTGLMHGAQLQLGLLYFGLFGSTAFLLYLQVSQLGAMPLRGLVALALIAIICAVIHFRRHARYVDTNLIQSSATNAGVVRREREPASVRRLSRFQKILNSLIGVLAITLMVLATVVAALELYIEGASTTARDDLAALQAGTSVSKITLMSLVLVPLFHPIVDIVNWQRLAAFARSRDSSYFKEGQWAAALKSFCAAYAVEVPLVGLLICLFGVVAGLTQASPTEGDAIRSFIQRMLTQDNSVATMILFFLLFGLFALAVSTLGSLFSAGLCTFRYDIAPMFWPENTSASVRPVEIRAKHLTLIAGLAIGLITLSAFHLAYAAFETTFAPARLLGLVFGVSSTQLSFTLLVIAPLIVGARGIGTLTPAWALAVLIISSAIGIGMTAIGLVIGCEPSLQWAVPGCLGSAIPLFVIAAFLRWRSVAGPRGA